MCVSGSSDIILENDYFRITVKEEGAELSSAFSKILNTEILWQAGPAWPKHAPVLFPVVGQLKDNIYQFKGTKFHLPRHGFARDKNFLPAEVTGNSVRLVLTDDEATLKVFPFHFDFQVQYHLTDDKLQMNMTVKNTGDDTMYCSYGAHPAFRVPLSENELFESYDLLFGSELSALERWPLKNNLISNQPEMIHLNNSALHLNRTLFASDAIVIKDPPFNSVSIIHREKGKGLKMQFGDWPYFGIWTASGGDFICLEPWQGIADTVLSTGKIEEKEGILSIPAKSTHSSSFTLSAVGL